MARRSGLGFDPTTKEGRRGLSMRLAEKRNEAIAKTTLLPVFRPAQVADQPKRSDR